MAPSLLPVRMLSCMHKVGITSETMHGNEFVLRNCSVCGLAVKCYCRKEALWRSILRPDIDPILNSTSLFWHGESPFFTGSIFDQLVQMYTKGDNTDRDLTIAPFSVHNGYAS
jgi:hypothetical protein